MGIGHFSQIFKAPREATIVEILCITEATPRFVDVEDTEILNEPVTLGKIEFVLKWVKRDKSLGPDGWPMKFYLTLFVHTGPDLLFLIEDYKISVQMHEGFNSTFLALIYTAQ